MKRIIYIAVVLVLASCKKGSLKHERYIENNSAIDTIIVINPDFDTAIDTILPGDNALIYSFEILDTEQKNEPCAWLGDTLIIKNLADESISRNVKVEEYWTYSMQGTENRLQKCTFIVIAEDFE